MVTADPTLLRRAVSNLVANAIRHTTRGSEVKMSVIASAGKIEISVRNPGSLIPPQMQAQIFDRFYRGDNARADSSSSSGLGLAIVKSIMELHRGSVSVSSDVANGTDFRLVFRA